MRQSGFTLIEVVMFLLISSLLMTTILLGASSALIKAPKTQQQWQGLQLAKGCLEWFVEQRRLNGYAAIPCPGIPATSNCPSMTGYTVSANVQCTSWNGDSNYKLINVSVTGLANVTLSTLIGEY